MKKPKIQERPVTSLRIPNELKLKMQERGIDLTAFVEETLTKVFNRRIMLPDLQAKTEQIDKLVTFTVRYRTLGDQGERQMATIEIKAIDLPDCLRKIKSIVPGLPTAIRLPSGYMLDLSPIEAEAIKHSSILAD